MEYWRDVVKNPTGIKAMDEFACTMNKVPKVVFSHTLKKVDWETARLAKRDLKEEVLQLKRGAGKDILVGSPGLIVVLMNLNLIDEFQLCIHPIILGSGFTPLFEKINKRTGLRLLQTKTFACGAVVFYYELGKNDD
jgi:dihydrofolate reductase